MSRVLAIESQSFGSDAYPESLFRLYAADRRTLFLVASSGGAFVGYVIARLDRWGAEIVSLAVDPHARGRGIGAALLRAAIRRMQRRSARSIRLMVHVNNTNAAEFYRRQGFRSVGRIQDYYEDGGTGIRMRLQLPHLTGARSKASGTLSARHPAAQR